MTNAQLNAAFVAAMKPFVKTPVVVTNIYVNNWQNDPYALGAWSHAPVNVGNQQFNAMQCILSQGTNEIWFIGEHCSASEYSYSHGAYMTGVMAANNSLGLGTLPSCTSQSYSY